jgi:hypothetical protein
MRNISQALKEFKKSLDVKLKISKTKKGVELKGLQNDEKISATGIKISS